MNPRHRLDVQLLPHVGVREENHTFRMVNKGVDALWCEVSKNRNNDGLVGVDCKERYSPFRGILRTKSNLVALLHSAFFKTYMELRDESRHLSESKLVSPIVAESRAFPIFTDCFCQPREIMFHWFIRHIVKFLLVTQNIKQQNIE